MRRKSCFVSDKFKAPAFSSKYLRRFVPGIGIISSPWASSQARASWPGVHFFSFAMASTRRTRPVIVRRKILEAFDLTCQKAAAQRAVRDEGDSQLTRGGQDFIFGITAPKRVLCLQRSDRMHFVRATDSVRGSFGQS